MKYLLLFMLLAIAGISCQKELSCEGPGCRGEVADNNAAYSFLQSNGNCTGFTANGIYTEQTSFAPSNSVSVTVHITKPGVYTITTDTVNQFFFTAVGTFADTGTRVVTLTAIGKPLSAGSFLFRIKGGCTFPVVVLPLPEYYNYDVTVDGVREKNNVGNFSGFKSIYGFSGFDSILIWSGITRLFTGPPSFIFGLNIYKGYLTNYGLLTNNDFKNFVALGPHPYSSAGLSDAITVEWRSPDNDIWASNYSPGTQPGSSFNITTLSDYTDTAGYYTVVVRAEFNCTLYNRIGNAKKLTNGKFYGEFKKL
jgi:hypothetical protein